MWKRFSRAFVFLSLSSLYVFALWLALNPERLPPLVHQGPESTGGLACTALQPVSERGFGLPSAFEAGEDPAPYVGEEGFEVLTFNGSLYVGMEADNRLGARLWRTRPGVMRPQSQADWEEVIADADGLPWGVAHLPQVDHIDSLQAFDGYLYASSANSGEPAGTRVFRSANGDPGTWEDALLTTAPGFGKVQNENFKDMIVFDGRLCGGTWNEVDGAEVWCTADGTHWEKKNEGGFGDPANAIIWSSEVFEGSLYFGVQRFRVPPALGTLDTALVYRARSLEGDPVWELVFDGGPVSGAAILLGEVWGELYLAVHSIDGIRIFASSSGDPGSWRPASRPGITGSRFNTGTVTDGAVLYRDRLMVSVRNPMTGARVWWLGEDGLWRLAHAREDQDPGRVAAQLAVFQDDLYLWTTDYALGQQVLRTHCAPVPGNAAFESPGFWAVVVCTAGVLGMVSLRHMAISQSIRSGPPREEIRHG